MSISATAAAMAQNTAAPQTTAPTLPTANTGKNTGKTSQHNMFRLKGQKIRETMSAEDKQLEGSKSDKVVFIGCLGDPSKPQSRKDGSNSVPSLVVVGYTFKALEDMKVPSAKIKEGYRSLMDVEKVEWKEVKAGEEFILNVCETGILICEPQYAGRFTGNGEEVFATFKFSQNRPEPLPVLKKAGTGSVKAVMDEIADVRPSADANGKSTYTIKPQYAEKFDVLYVKRTATRKSAGGKATPGEVQKDLAAAFRAYMQDK